MIEETEESNEEEFMREDTVFRIYTQLYSIYKKHGLIQQALKIGLETLFRFPNEPAAYQNLADGLWAGGLKNEAREILQRAVELFPDDSELLEFLQDVEHDMFDPDGGETLPLLGVILLAVLIQKKVGKKF